MSLFTPEPVAMILPLPTLPGEDAVEFVALDAYADIFADLERCFDPPAPRGGFPLPASIKPQGLLRVQQVGGFEASFVPSRADFVRLDSRFRIDDRVWDAIPEHARSGFAVFKLREGESRVHPMAFRFRTREPKTLFFPAIHVHDGKVHSNADFDHTFLAQDAAPTIANEASAGPVEGHVSLDRAKGLVTKGPIYRRKLRGRLLNKDIRMAIA
jgi:hypothetical protein